MHLLEASLDDKYALQRGRVYLSGVQALVRLALLQRQRDEAVGLRTAGFISGYRGSPLAPLDKALWDAQKFLQPSHIHFWPGLNEDLAATAVWGSQQVNLFPRARYDGVFAMWYGKGPGVDRCGDVFKHANFAGTSRHGGVLVVAGDDHAATSSSLPHQSDHDFAAAMIPVLAPASVQEYLDLGVHGWAMSRFSGCWVGFKALADTVESSASVEVDPRRVQTILPYDFGMPPDGANIRWPDTGHAQERRMHDFRIYAALAYARANRLNHVVIDSPRPRFGIIASGKAYLDVRQAMDDLGIDDRLAAAIGLRLFKVGMPWPLEAEGVRHFAEGLEEILVVEEKRQMIEYQLKEQLYNWREDVRPRVIGKFDEHGEWLPGRGDWLLPAVGELTPSIIARVLAGRIARFYTSETIQRRLALLEQKERALTQSRIDLQRIPFYCSGCPHNTSTKVPEGSHALAGIGCHYMATWIYPDANKTFTQMGGEGVTWIGQAPFTDAKHVFANLGDGTYFHSGSLAIRAAIAAGVNITYKLLYNDAVAMTGGQPIDGVLTVPQITRQLAAEGVARQVIVSDDPRKYAHERGLAEGVKIYHRDALDRVQRELRECEGVSVLIYEQTCAAEKRRRRKRGRLADPPKRVFINEGVCEGCGDCGVKSNCVSVQDVETEFGRKRRIDQSACNKDYSCLKGFCPSFVTVEGGSLRRGNVLIINPFAFGDIPQPILPDAAKPYGILVTGVGGTRVITIGGILGMASHLEGKGVTVLDMTGMSQKNGAVTSHVRIAQQAEDLHAVRIATGEADAVLGCDILVAVSPDSLSRMQAGLTRCAINSTRVMPGTFARNPDLDFPDQAMRQQLIEAVGSDAVRFVDAARLATALCGDALATNVFLLGYAWQLGLVPLSEEAILRAIDINAAGAQMNRAAFRWGRLAAYDLARVEQAAQQVAPTRPPRPMARTLDERIALRERDLVAYQDAAYAQRYRDLVERVRAVEARAVPASTLLTDAVARSYHKLLAYKDEYEVARLYSNGDFRERLNETFKGDYKLKIHLAPPLLSSVDPNTGEPRKIAFGGWMLPVMRALARWKRLRGTRADPFGWTAERKMERQLIVDFERDVEQILSRLSPENHAIALQIAQLPLSMRGFGHVKRRNVEGARKRREALMAQLEGRAAMAASELETERQQRSTITAIVG
ncbi:MAG TPA: indolepyruvate ferredoxin oxidoreductase family protein [Burkholderiales bacterium]|nr:indolepyruvate ferredoxin oxidoreductase family protein [Burkholderiales bacterium]